jgi:hypothetical protein
MVGEHCRHGDLKQGQKLRRRGLHSHSGGPRSARDGDGKVKMLARVPHYVAVVVVGPMSESDNSVVTSQLSCGIGPRTLPFVLVRFSPKIFVVLLYEISAQATVLLYFGRTSVKNAIFSLQGPNFPSLKAHQTLWCFKKISRAPRDLLYG